MKRFIERMMVEANKSVFNFARANGVLTETILETIAKDRENRIKYLIDNKIITIEELNHAINE